MTSKINTYIFPENPVYIMLQLCHPKLRQQQP